MHRVVANGLEGPCVFRPVLLDRHAVTDNEKFPFPIDAAVQLTAIVLDRLGIVIGSPHTARGGDDLRRMICEKRDADAIVPEVLLAPRALDRAMLRMLAPADERLLALPPRVRQQDIRSVHAGVSIDKENTTAPLQLRLQSRREFEVACRVAIKRGHLEEQSDQAFSPPAERAGSDIDPTVQPSPMSAYLVLGTLRAAWVMSGFRSDVNSRTRLPSRERSADSRRI
jgi:hypothetical protein